MASKTFSLNARAALLGLIAAAYPVVGYTAPAARVDFTTGDVKAIGPNGQSRNLSKGSQVEQGETIATNKGRAQLRFTDGAYVSLQPESEFRIDQYRFDGKQDGNEKSFFSLVKGGLRTITGLVGKTNKNNYQITTSVATIGIRGTEYTIQYGQSIVGTVGEGEINVCNGAGCLSVTNGESYYVQSQEIRPVLTNKRTDLPPPSPQNPPSTFAEGEQVNENGDPCTLFPGSCGIVAPLLTGSGKFNVAYAGEFFGPGVTLGSDAELDTGKLISFNRGFVDTLSGPYSDVGGDDILVWGRAASNSGGEVTHYVVGVPTSDLSALGGMMATYTMSGATQITSSSGNVVGKLNAMTMTADFWSAGFSDLTVSMKMTIGSMDRNSIVGSGSMSNGVLSFFASQSLASGSLSVSANGFFAGTNAARAGFAYSVNDNEQGISGKGAVGLKQTGISTSTSSGNF